MDDIQGKIIENVNVAPGYYRITIMLSKPLGRVSPGQFVMIGVPGREVFLRRPFSIYGVREKRMTVMYRVVGTGTAFLSKAATGVGVMVLGPLGRGFTLKKTGECLVVAGGIGFAGLKMVIDKLGDRATLFLGITEKAELSITEGLKIRCMHTSTLDGSNGFKGNVVDLLGKHLDSYRGKNVEIFACGPVGMVKSLKALLGPVRIPCQVSVEERMACGMGLCFGCAVETKDEANPFKRVCKEGPVFSLWDLSL